MYNKSGLVVPFYLSIVPGSLAMNKLANIPVNDKAPVFSTHTIRIKATPDKVWAILTNIDEWTTWQTEISKAKLNGLLQPNSTFYFKTGGMKIHSKLHTVEPYTIFGWTGKVYTIRAIHNWTFKEIDGSTEVTVSESMEGVLAKLFKKSFNISLEKGMIRSLELLKKTCE